MTFIKKFPFQGVLFLYKRKVFYLLVTRHFEIIALIADFILWQAFKFNFLQYLLLSAFFEYDEFYQSAVLVLTACKLLAKIAGSTCWSLYYWTHTFIGTWPCLLAGLSCLKRTYMKWTTRLVKTRQAYIHWKRTYTAVMSFPVLPVNLAAANSISFGQRNP